MQQQPYRAPAPRFIGPRSRDLMLKPNFRNTTTTFIPARTRPADGELSSTSPAQLIQTPIVQKPMEPYAFPSNFVFAEHEIRNSPSFRKHNISADEEITLRRVGTCFIKQLTSRINKKITIKNKQISARATCMAMVYFHRFYMYHSFVTFLPIEMATTCLFLACKAEDCPKSINVFSEYYYCLTHNGDELQEHEYGDVNQLIEAYEIRLLQTLAFEFRIELPHIAVINASFHSPSDYLKKIAWRFSTDMLAFTTLCLQYDGKVLAATAFYVAAAYLDIDMKKQYGQNWIQSIAPLLTEDVLMKIVDVFLEALKDMKIIIQSKNYELEEGEIL